MLGDYQVASNGDFGRANGIDLTIQNRGLLVNTIVQYTLMSAKANGDYDAAAFGSQYVDAPSQQYLMSFDREKSPLNISKKSSFPL